MAGMYAEAPAAVERAYVPGSYNHCGASKHDGTPCEGAEGRDRQWILERVVLLKVTTPDDVLPHRADGSTKTSSWAASQRSSRCCRLSPRTLPPPAARL